MPAICVPNYDGVLVPLSACTCQQPWIAGYEYGDTGCPIDRHAQLARTRTWHFDDEGKVYESNQEEY